nr:hypothetical protein [uncultured Mediterranean phage uvMED]
MSVETASDRLLMISDFGETVSFIPNVGATVNIKGIFDNTYHAVDAGGTVDFVAVQPRLTVRSSDVENAAEGDEFVIRGLLYDVKILMDDGTGITEVALEAQ